MALSGFGGIGRALGHASFRTYIIGHFVSLIGTWVHRVAVGWLAWELTRSAGWVGAIAFADLFPTAVFGPIAGALVDRVLPLKMARITQTLALLQAVALAVLVASGAMTIWLLFALSLTLGIIIASHHPVRLTLTYKLVARENLAPATGLAAMTFNLARFVGPALAGLIIAWWDVAAAFAFNAATYVVFLYTLFRVRLHDTTPPAGRTGNIVQEIRDGLLYAVRHPGIGPAFALLILTSFLTRPYAELLPAFAGQVFGRGATALAWMTAAAGLGAICGSFWLAWRARIDGLTGVVVFNIALGGASVIGFTLVSGFWWSLPFLVLAGGTTLVAGVGTQTLVQNALAGEYRGRVMSLYGLVIGAAPALGALVMGAIGDATGLRWPVAGGAVLVLLVWGVAIRHRRRLAAALEV